MPPWPRPAVPTHPVRPLLPDHVKVEVGVRPDPGWHQLADHAGCVAGALLVLAALLALAVGLAVKLARRRA